MARGQVTLFVIIGLVLLVGVGLFFAMRAPEPQEQNTNVDTQPVITFVESCLYNSAKNGLLIAGAQGGDIYLAGLTYSEERPWIGNAVKNGPLQVPYWHHVEQCAQNTYGCIANEQPPLCRVLDACVLQSAGPNSIQEQLEAYIARDITECLDGFRAFAKTHAIVMKAPPRAQVIFAQDDVDIRLRMPLEIDDLVSGGATALEKFSTTLDVDFEETYRLANAIAEVERDTTFIEENLLHLMSVYQGIGNDLLPPARDIGINEQQYWVRSQVQEAIEDEVLPYLNFMQVMNAQRGYAPITVSGVDGNDPYAPYAEGIFLYNEIDLGGEAFPDHSASFLYPYTPIYLNINDREILRGQNLAGSGLLASILPMMVQFKFKYDLSFPLLVTVQDANAFGGEGFAFTYALEGNIINNQPVLRSTQFIDLRTGQTNVDLNSPAHHVQRNLSITIRDKHTGAPINDATLFYECGYRFTIGVTDDQGHWEGTAPYCAAGGVLLAESPLIYARAAVPFVNTRPGPTAPITFSLWPIAKKRVVVFKVTPADLRNLTINNDRATWRHELLWGKTTNFSINLSATTGEALYEGDTIVAGETNENNVTVNMSEYAFVILERKRETSFDDPVPLVGTITFGSDDGSLRSRDEYRLETLRKMAADGQLTQQQLDEITAAMGAWQQYEIELTRSKEIDLIPGAYNYEGFLFYKGLIRIPKEKRRVGPFWDAQTIVLPSQNFTTWLEGGAALMDSAAFTLTEAQVYSDDTLILYVLAQPLPMTWKQLEKNYKPVEEYQQGKERFITPTVESSPQALP